uniref:Phosphatidylinositol-3-phosphatase SAC1 n=1 Tax=Globodera pallida TaxID=36090 RepID=A0A183C0F4_GLOPA
MGSFRLGEHYLVLVKSVLSVGQLFNCDLHKITNVQFVPLHGASSQNQTSEQIDARVVEMQKFLSAGIFYFSSSTKQNNYDLTHSLQRRQEKGDRSRSDFRFYWNRTLFYPFERFDVPVDNWLVKIICGSVLVRTIYVGHRTAKVALISRLSCDYVGTRFNDAGNVANFVETEQLVTFEEKECSFVQVRGSVPLFWEQPGINVGSHTIKLKPLEWSHSFSVWKDKSNSLLLCRMSCSVGCTGIIYARMSLRNVRIYKKILGNGTSSVLVDSTVNEDFLLLQCGGVLTLSKDVGNALRQQYAKISDGYALLGIHRISACEHYLVLVKSVLSVGQLFNCDLVGQAGLGSFFF